MRAIYKASCIQIEITNHCNLTCANCTRFCGHHEKPYFMSLNQVEDALLSLEGFLNTIGCMGGEPTLHPRFREICTLFQLHVPFKRRGLWTNGLYWDKYEDIIRETFPIGNIVYNAHDYEYTGQHQPLLIASKDVVKDEVLRKELIDNCWVQKRWSPSINPNGAYFCEVAAAMGMLFDIKGYPIEKDWWCKAPKDFQDQVETFCSKCSAAIPFDAKVYESKREYISLSNVILKEYPTEEEVKRYLELIPKMKASRFKIIEPNQLYNRQYTREDYERNLPHWKPGKFREWYQCEPTTRLSKEEFERL